jgi:mono/diheme cytochrome c family protein
MTVSRFPPFNRAAFFLLRFSFFVLSSSLLAACNPGAYPVDAFNEMHYQPSQRRLEPDRLAPPPDAVPVTGAAPDFTFDEATGLQNSIVRGPQTLQRAGDLYRVNCAMCHGADGHGQSVVADQFKSAGIVPPVDFASQRVQARTDGQIYWLVGHGLGGMPPFRHLLSDDDLWTVVLFVRQVQGK